MDSIAFSSALQPDTCIGLARFFERASLLWRYSQSRGLRVSFSPAKCRLVFYRTKIRDIYTSTCSFRIRPRSNGQPPRPSRLKKSSRIRLAFNTPQV